MTASEANSLDATIAAYQRQGYRVRVHPSPADLPEQLRSHRPDMIAEKEGETVVVEVKSRTFLQQAEVRELASKVRLIPGWRFDLVLAGDEQESPKEEIKSDEILLRLGQAKTVLPLAAEAAYLLAWSCIEAVLRLVLRREGLELRAPVALSLVKTAYSHGLFDESDFTKLISAYSDRNRIAHGVRGSGNEPVVSVPELIQIAERILNDEERARVSVLT